MPIASYKWGRNTKLELCFISCALNGQEFTFLAERELCVRSTNHTLELLDLISILTRFAPLSGVFETDQRLIQTLCESSLAQENSTTPVTIFTGGR